MSRVKRGPKRAQKRRKVLKQAKGFFGTKSNAYRMAKQAVERAGKFATRDRRAKKRSFRSLWIVRINAAAHEHGLSYNRFINGLRLAGCTLDRKVLANLAASEDPKPFANLVDLAKQALEKSGQAAKATKPAKSAAGG